MREDITISEDANFGFLVPRRNSFETTEISTNVAVTWHYPWQVR
jgi:hypothetical protein